jgi:hypothetical protein
VRQLLRWEQDRAVPEHHEDEHLREHPGGHGVAHGVSEGVPDHRAGERGEQHGRHHRPGQVERDVVAQLRDQQRDQHSRDAADERHHVPRHRGRRPRHRQRLEELVALPYLLVGHQLRPEDHPDHHEVDDRYAGRHVQRSDRRDVVEEQPDADHEPGPGKDLDRGEDG